MSIFNIFKRKNQVDNSKEIKLVLLIDEAQRVCKDKTHSFMSKISAEMRKYGLMLITSTQMPTELDKSIIANSAIKITFYQDEPEEFDYVVRLLTTGYDREQTELISKAIRDLGIGDCMVYTNNELTKIRGNK